MKKHLHKIKIAAENLSSRSGRTEYKDDEVNHIEKTVEKYKEIFEKFLKKFPPYSINDKDKDQRDKRLKKVAQYKLAEALEESSKDLPPYLELYQVLKKSGEMEKALSCLVVDTEIENESKIGNQIKPILDNDVNDISTSKRNFSKCLADYKSLKKSHENAVRLDEHPTKITQLQLDLDQCEAKVEQLRDIWAAQMYDLIAKDEIIVKCIHDYLLSQKDYHQRALKSMEDNLTYVSTVIASSKLKKNFGVSLKEHLKSTADKEIAFPIEFSICCLLEHGLNEEGLLRVGCASTKLKRMKSAIDARCFPLPLSIEYQDIHVIASLLKLYLRELPEPLLTNKLYLDFIRAAQLCTEAERKMELKKLLGYLPQENYANLRYLTKFLCLVVENSDRNKMSSHNVAIVMSPNLLWPPKNFSTEDYSVQMNSSSAVNTLVDILINHWDYLFDNAHVEFYHSLSKGNLYAKSNQKKENTTYDNHNNHNNNSNAPPVSMKSAQSEDAINHRVDEDNFSRSSILNSPKNNQRRKYNKTSAPSPPAKTPNSSQKPQIPTSLPLTIESKNNSNSSSVDNVCESIGQPQAEYHFKKTSEFIEREKFKEPEKENVTSIAQPKAEPQIEKEQHVLPRNGFSENHQPTTTILRPVPSPRTCTTPITTVRDGETQTTYKPNLPEKPVIPKRPNLNNLLYVSKEELDASQAEHRNSTSPTAFASVPTVFRYSNAFKEIPFIDTPTDSDDMHSLKGLEDSPSNIDQSQVSLSTPITPVCKPRTPTGSNPIKRPQVPAPPPPTPTTTTATTTKTD